jgi:hypothetical protein
LLIGDAVFLIIMGVFGLASDLASYVAGSGSFQSIFQNDPRVIGVVEAHGLAVLTGIAGFAHASSNRTRYWHLHFAATHLLLGGANIAFFGVFSMVQAALMGAVITAIHFGFVVAQIVAYRDASGRAPSGQAAPPQ